MNKKWLLKEIELWREEQIIGSDSAEILKNRYSAKGNTGTLTIIFSILGSLLIGTGIILIFAKNWYLMPRGLKIVLSVLPLLVGQGLAVFTLIKKYSSLAIREGVAIFYTAGVFTAIAMISQTFHLPYDLERYLLVCGLLVLPIIFILDAVSPLAVYFYAVVNWGALAMNGTRTPVNTFLFLLLFGVGVFYVFMNRKKAEDIRHVYTLWISAIAGFAVTLVFAFGLEIDGTDVFLVCLVFFSMLFAADKNRDDFLLPFKPLSILGGLVIMMILSYGWMFETYEYYQIAQMQMNPWLLTILVVTMAASLLLGYKHYKGDKGKFLFLIAMLSTCVLLVAWSIMQKNGFLYTILINLITGAIGVGIIVTGVKSAELSVTNLGMLVTIGLIVMRFFDENLDVLWRGVAFLILGGVFLFINFRMMKKRKQALKGEEAAVV